MTLDPSTTSQPVDLGADPAALGRLERLDARNVWKHEALNFTPWLLEHPDLLADALGVDVELSEREVGVGAFSVDLVGRIVGTDQIVIVENQLAATDHSHLGQLLTYAAGLEAAYIVWVTPEFREEHRRALDWLNEVTRENISFFGLELEILRIVQANGVVSPPAPNFKLVAQPNNWQKYARSLTASSENALPSERRLAYQAFFTDVLEQIKQRQPSVTRAQRAQPESWFNLSAGRTGFGYGLSFTRDGRFRVELFIDTGDATTNKTLLGDFMADRDAIEQIVGEQLSWEPLENRRTSRVAVYRNGRINETEQLEDLKRFAVDAFFKFREAFGPRIAQLTIPRTASVTAASEVAE